MESEKKIKPEDALKELQGVDVGELEDADLESIAGGVVEMAGDCNCGCPEPSTNCNCKCGAT